MISREAWFLHLADLDRQRELLHQMFDRGQLTAEEFALKIHRLWRGGDSSLLERDDKGRLLLTQDWIYHYGPALRKAAEVTEEWRYLTSQAHTFSDGTRLRPWRTLDSPRQIQESVVPDWPMAKVQSVLNFLRLFRYGVSPGEPVSSFTQGSNLVPLFTEEEFNEWFSETLASSETLVTRFREWIDYYSASGDSDDTE